MQQVIEGFRLSQQQTRLWLFQQQSHAYWGYCSILIEGPLDSALLYHTLEKTLKRHESYRTLFHSTPGLAFPLQVIQADPAYTWCSIDLRSVDPQEQERQIKIFAQKEKMRMMNDERGPLLSSTLFTLREQTALWSIHLPALHADAQTLQNLVREVAQGYASLGEHADALIQYLQFSQWQDELLQQDRDDERAFWQKRDLTTFSHVSLPFKIKTTQPHSFTPDVITLPFGFADSAPMELFLEQQQCALPVFLLTCWSLLLWKLTDHDELLIGLSADGRIDELQGTAGLLTKCLPLVCCLQKRQTVEELLVQMQEAMDDVLSLHSTFSWEELEGVAGPASFWSPFSFEWRDHLDPVTAGGVSFALQQWESYSEPFHVKLVVVHGSAKGTLQFHFDQSLFHVQDIQRVADQFCVLVEHLVRWPDQPLETFDILSVAERQQLLIQFNQTEAAYPHDVCLHQMVEHQVARTPDTIAVESEQGQLTYQHLNHRAKQLAHYLQQRGVGPDVLVGIGLDRSLELIIGVLGILKAGGAYVPLDTTYPEKRLRIMMQEAHLSFVVTMNPLRELFPVVEQMVCLDRDWISIASSNGEDLLKSVTPTNLAYVLYTSGSTGQPKGVMIPHQGVVHYVDWSSKQYAVASGFGSPVHSSLSFDLTVTSIFPVLVVGRRLVLLPDGGGIEALRQILSMRNAFSLLKITPAHLNILAQSLRPEELAEVAQALIIGGEALLSEQVQVWRHSAPATRLINEYGPTETVVGCCIYELPHDEEVVGGVPIGRPIANTQIYLLDAHLRLVPLGVPGELYIGGVGVGRGYLNRPDLTAERFIAHPFSREAGARLYKTGDRARYRSADGTLEYLGRLDTQVKLRGYRIEIAEIEAALRQHPLVLDCVVLLQEEGLGAPWLVGYVVAPRASGSELMQETFAQMLRNTLPEYMVPSIFILLDVLPLTSNGKVDRRQLPRPDQVQERKTVVQAEPRSPLEEILLTIWKDLLVVPSLGIHDNFFAVGGHSLLATRLITRIRVELKVELPVRTVFELPTIAKFAQRVEQTLCQGEASQMPPLVAGVRPEVLPLSFAQQRLWFLEQLDPGNTAYLLPNALRMDGKVNANALERALEELIGRHESLRTTFAERERQPMQVIHLAGPFLLPLIDLQGLGHDQAEACAYQLAQQEAQHPCDLVTGPLLRTALLRLADETCVLLLTLHHIITDGWSTEVLVQEFTIIYQALLTGEPFPLAPLPIQYADYVLWQRAWLQGEVLEAQISYWRTQLAKVPPLEVPTDHARPAMLTHRGASLPFQESPLLLEQLKALSQQQHVTLFMLLLASFQVLLARYTGQRDISVGTPIANRRHAEIEGVIGFFINTLVLRTDLAGDPTFQQVLQRVREVCLGAYAHQDIPFEKVVEELAPQRDLSRSPLFQVLFTVQNIAPSQTDLAEVSVGLLGVENTISKFDLSLSLVETGQELSGMLEYNTDLFEVETIVRLLTHWQTLLYSIVRNPQAHLWELPLLTPQEQELLRDWNATQVAYPQDLCVHELFEQQVQHTPEAVALVFEEQQLTYRQLNRRANQLAHHLQTLGVGIEVLVGICMERSLELIIGLLGVLKAGGAYVPLDPGYPQERLTFLLQNAQTHLLLVLQEKDQKKVPESHCPIVYLDTQWQHIAQEPQHNPVSGTQIDTLAYVIYTSGSTGTPKGVMISHRAIGNRLLWGQQVVGLSTSDRVAQVASFSFDISLWEIFAPLQSGACVVLARPDGYQDRAYLLALLEQEQITIIHVVPTVFQMLMDGQRLEQCEHLRWVLYGGEASPADLPQRFFAQSRAQLQQFYGPTEAAISVTSWTGDPQMPARLAGIGRPIANMQVYVLDAEEQSVPIGIIGEMYLGGVGLARGYINGADLSAERFVPHPFSQQPGERLYKTGDLARYCADGSLEYRGRRDQQVKLRGYRIELGEIEAALQRYPGIEEAAVLLQEESSGNRRLVAYVVGQPGERLRNEELYSVLQDRLPVYMLPSEFVFLEALPLTPNGKIDRRALPLPAEIENEEKHGKWEARTPLEELLLGLWHEVLGHRRMGIHGNFFGLGGHSLLATQLLARVRQVLEVEVSLRALFEAPTVAAFALRVEQALREGKSIEVPPMTRERPEVLPLSFAQQRLWFLDRLEPESTVYLTPIALSIGSKIDIHSMKRTLEELIHRHESLRTTFEERDGQPIQVIHPASSYTLPVIDLQGLKQEQAKAHAYRLLHQESQCPCNLVKGPLLRTYLLHIERHEYILLLTLHNIITDGWSNGILMQEFSTLYQAMAAEHPSPLAPLPMQYADYALWQRQWFQGEVLEAQLAYWRTQLAGIPPLELPTDHLRPALQTHRGAIQTARTSSELSKQLMALSQQQSVTMFMLLLATFQILFARYSGQHDISIGTPIANRRHAELEGVVGFFQNMLVLRTDLARDPTFEQVLFRVREVCLGAYMHQDLPFEKIVEALAPVRDLSRSPLFQIMLVMLNTPQVKVELEEGSITPLVEEAVTSNFDLNLTLEETERGLSISLEYNTDLFAQETIVRLLSHWQTMLQAVVRNPQTLVSEIPLLTTEEREHLLREWNATQKAYPQEFFTHQLFEQQVQHTPDAIAVVDELESLTYCELNTHANQVARHLQGLGVGPEMLVGVYMERSPELIIVLLALFKVGGVYVPLDPTYPEERLAWICEDAQFGLILTQARVAATLLSAQIPCLYVDTERPQWRTNPSSNLTNQITGENLAYVIYTSGSTGRPKGAMIEHRGLLNHLYVNIEEVGLTSNDRMAQTAALCFDISVWQLLATLLVGGCTVMYGPDVVSQPTLLMKHVQVDQITVFEPVPSFVQAMLDSIDLDHRETHRLSSLRWLMPTGEALSPQLCRRWFASYPDIPLLNAYGPTECSDDVTFYSLRQPPAINTLHIPIGRPVNNMHLYVLDQRKMVLPIGIAGELYIGGIGVGRGYLNNFQRTAEVFLPDPFVDEPGQRMYKTGDRVRYLPGGALEFLGRMDQQVKVRGFRIELGEIEEALRVHPAVQEAIMLLHEEVAGDQRLVAYVVLFPGERLNGKELRTTMQKRLPMYMLPSEFVFLDVLPLTPNGKVDRNALPSPREVEAEQSMQQEVRTPQEELLLSLWCEVLGRRQIGIHDNFFELGGHSLLIIQLLTRIRAILGVEVPLRAVFEAPTVAGVAHRVEQILRQGKGIEEPPLVARERPSVLPLSFAQQRLWFIDQLESGSTAYLISNSLRIYEAIDVYSLERSLQELILRHESLRTTFEERDGQPMQVIHQANYTPLPVIDLQGLRQENREQHGQRLSQQEEQFPCDLARGPLLRFCLVRLGGHEQMLLLTLHHIITDGWSNQVLMREIVMLYHAFTNGERSPLAPLPIQYVDYALWQRQWLQGEVLEAQLAYWTRRLGGVPSIKLPANYPRPAVASTRGAVHSFALSTELSQALVTLTHQEGITLFMLLLAAFQVLFYRYTGQEDIVMGTDSANRHRIETEGIIGFFVNLLVLRTDLSGKPTFREVLKRVREGSLEAYTHQDIPFELLVEKLASDRSLERTPLVQVLFVLQNMLLEAEQNAEIESSVEQEAKSQTSLSPIMDGEMPVKFDLALFMQERNGKIFGTVKYRLDLFNASTIAAMMVRFETLLQSVVKQPDLPIDLLELVSDAEHLHQEQEEQEQRSELYIHDSGWLDLADVDFT